MSIADSVRARRYLLQEATEEERAAVEREYLEHADALDRIASAEADLIEEYLSHQLSPGERVRFERIYLAAPHRRTRVDMIRRLMGRGLRPAAAHDANAVAGQRGIGGRQWLALAASLLFGAGSGLWVASPFGVPRTTAVQSQTIRGPVRGPDDGSLGANWVLDLTLSSITSRSRSAIETVLLPAGIEVVVIHLEGDANTPLIARRVSIRIAGGQEVWASRVAYEPFSPGIVARIEVPATMLPSDDYIVTLYGSSEAGIEREMTEYFLRIRSD